MEKQMEYIFMGVIFIIVVAAMLFIKTLNLGAGLTIALVAPLILLAIYSLARIQPKETTAGNSK
jgi:uncharacterized membrane protein YobD (UPF0266 family)